jgi:hypothetical protein
VAVHRDGAFVCTGVDCIVGTSKDAFEIVTHHGAFVSCDCPPRLRCPGYREEAVNAGRKLRGHPPVENARSPTVCGREHLLRPVVQAVAVAFEVRDLGMMDEAVDHGDSACVTRPAPFAHLSPRNER